MDREIKFRAWDKKYKEMASFQKLMVNIVFAIADGLDPKQFIVIPFHENVVLMQFTGLKDKNGNDIYEGDILGGYPHGTVSVRWSSRFACFESFNPFEKENNLFANDLEDCADAWEVIGNIFENPELLNNG